MIYSTCIRETCKAAGMWSNDPLIYMHRETCKAAGMWSNVVHLNKVSWQLL